MIYYPRGMHQQTAFASIHDQQVCDCAVSAIFAAGCWPATFSLYYPRRTDQVVDAILKEVQ